MQEKLRIDGMKAQAALMKVQNDAKDDELDRQKEMVEHNDWYELELQKLDMARKKLDNEAVLRREQNFHQATQKAADRLHKVTSERENRQHQQSQQMQNQQHDAAKTQFTAQSKAKPNDQP